MGLETASPVSFSGNSFQVVIASRNATGDRLISGLFLVFCSRKQEKATTRVVGNPRFSDFILVFRPRKQELSRPGLWVNPLIS